MSEAVFWESKKTLVGKPPRAYGGGFGHVGRVRTEGYVGTLTCPEGSYTGVGPTDALALRSAERMRAVVLKGWGARRPRFEVAATPNQPKEGA